jgi:hypothetical protein
MFVRRFGDWPGKFRRPPMRRRHFLSSLAAAALAPVVGMLPKPKREAILYTYWDENWEPYHSLEFDPTARMCSPPMNIEQMNRIINNIARKQSEQARRLHA